MNTKKCNLCGDVGKRIIKHKALGDLCSRCYQRQKNSKTYPLPVYGEIGYNEDGKPICHICGKAYNKVLAHVWQIHGLSEKEYKVQFGLQTSTGIMSKQSREVASKRNKENYELVVEKNLIKKGVKTRFKEGSKGRTRDMVSEFTMKRLKNKENFSGKW